MKGNKMEGERMLTKKQKLVIAQDIVARYLTNYCCMGSCEADHEVLDMTAREVYRIAFAVCKDITGSSWKAYCAELEQRHSRRIAA